MSKNLTPKGKIVRRFGINIFGNPKYDRLLSKKNNPPGPIRRRRRKISEFGKRLVEKQKLRYGYGLSERQMRMIVDKAKKSNEVTGHAILILLERRLDNVVFRLGFGQSAAQARQMIVHGHIKVNGRRVTIPSYSIKVGDVVTVRDHEKSKRIVMENMSKSTNRTVPEWLNCSADELKGTVERFPARTEIPTVVDEQLVVEFYSR